MEVISVNVGLPREIGWRGLNVRTSIFKRPVDGSVMVRRLNLDGDQQSDLMVHGGAAKAVYAYPSEHYKLWQKELPGVAFSWGHFGENLTTRGLREDTLHIGDRLRVGSAVLTVTQPRMPCYKLGLRFERDDMVERFLVSRRSGFYFSVEKEGEIEAGSEIELVESNPERVSIADVLNLYLGTERSPELIERALRVDALPEGWKEELIAKLQRLEHKT